MQFISPICFKCVHFLKGNPLSCTAYPEGIPKEILVSSVDHKQPYEGDNGIQFELKPLPKEKELDDYVKKTRKKYEEKE